MDTPPEGLARSWAADWLGSMERDHLIDGVRALAVLAVVVYHALFFEVRLDAGNLVVTRWQPGGPALVAGWFVMLLPMFFIASGFGHAAAAARTGPTAAGAGGITIRRVARIAGPLVLFVGVLALVSTAAAWTAGAAPPLPYPGTAGLSWQELAAAASRDYADFLWFLTVYLVVVVLAPAMVRANDRWGLRALVVLILGAGALDLAGAVVAPAWRDANWVVVWLACHQLGVALHRGWLRRGPAWRPWATLGTATAGVVVLVALGYPVSPIANYYPPSLALASLAVAHTATLALLGRAGVARHLSDRTARRLAVLNAHLLTIYLWQAACIIAAILLLAGIGRALPATAPWLVSRPGIMVASFGVIAAVGAVDRPGGAPDRRRTDAPRWGVPRTGGQRRRRPPRRHRPGVAERGGAAPGTALLDGRSPPRGAGGRDARHESTLLRHARKLGAVSLPNSPIQPRMSPRLVALLGLIAALGAVSMDIYLPSLPAVAEDLGTSAAAAQLTISGVLIGAGLGQLLMGPLSDRYGRRRPALVGIGVHVLASVGCMVAPTIQVLIVMRMVQGIGNSAATVTAMAVIRDLLTGGPAARVLSRLILVIGIAPLLAPSLGGLIAGVGGWRAVFGALALFGIVLGVLVHRLLPDTLPPGRRITGGARPALRGYWHLVRDREFMALALVPALAMSTILSYVSGAPFVLQLGFGLSAQQFALVFALNGAGGIIMSQVNAALVRRHEPIAILRVALPAGLVLAVLLVGVAATGAGGLFGLLVPLWMLMSSVMFLPANATALALSRHGERAGTAAALVGALQSGLAGVISPLVGILGGDAVAMSVTIAGALAAALAVFAAATPAYRR